MRAGNHEFGSREPHRSLAPDLRRLSGFKRRALPTLLAEVIAVSLAMFAAAVPAHAAASCASTGPSSYIVTVCIDAPASGASATGNLGVAASVTIIGASPGIRRLEFTLDAGYLITDFVAPYAFQLPSASWVDGSHQLAAHALLRDGFTSSGAAVTLNFANGVSQPPPLPTGFAPRNVGGSHPVVAAAGDGPDGPMPHRSAPTSPAAVRSPPGPGGIST